LTSWEYRQEAGSRQTDEHKLLLAQGRLQPGVQFLGYPNSYADKVEMELWSDKNTER
jgi:hypothetical protein